jgi:4-aminobutyrate aminotransferase
VTPDIVAMAKGIASGMPLGVALSRADLMTWPPGAHASTFGGNPIACAAALETIRLLKEQLIRNAEIVGARLKEGLASLASKHPMIGDVRGRGLMVGVELVRDRTTKERAIEERNAVVYEAFSRGLLVLGAGKNTVRFCPPLVLTAGQADTAVRLFDEALGAVERSTRAT